MLQPAQNQQLMTARIIWAALTFSTFVYGLLLFILGKISVFAFPAGDLRDIQILALCANALAVMTFFLHKDRVLPNRGIEERIPTYVLCWAINESIAVMGFIAVFLSDDGNGFFYVTNLAVALTANFMTFPKSE